MNKFVLSLAGSLALALGSHASAQVTLNSHSGSLGSVTSTQRNDTSGGSGNGYSNLWVGASRLSEGNGTGTQFMAYCIDPRTGAGFPNTYQKTSLDSFFGVGVPAASYAASGYSQQLQRSVYSDMTAKNTQANALVVRNNLDELFSYAYADSLSSAVNAAAFGLAVWEVIMQDGASFGRTTGEIRTQSTGTDPSVITKLGQYLSALSAAPASEATAWSSAVSGPRKSYSYSVYFDTSSPFSQNFIRATENRVPVPGTLALAGFALAGMVVVRRRKQA